MTDQELICGLIRADTAALSNTIDKYGAYVGKIILVFLSDKMTAEDIEEATADVFVSLWNSREKLCVDRELRPYIAEISRNAARKKLRYFRDTQGLPTDEILESPLPSPDYIAQQREDGARLKRAIERLAPSDQEIFIRYYYIEQKIEEISFATGMPPSTIKSRLMRGRSKLKKILKESEATISE